MLPCSLDDPDSVPELNHSALVAARLRTVYQSRRDDSFPHAQRILEPLVALPMSATQKMLLRFAIGCEAIHDQRARQAIEYLDEALDIASDRDDAGAFAVIAQKLAYAHYVLHSFVSATAYYEDAREAAQAYRIADAPSEQDTAFQKQAFLLELLWGLTTQYFLTADYSTAQTYVEEARRLARTLDRPHRRIATTEWTAALVQRWQHKPLDAYTTILEARKLYRLHSFGSPVEHARLDIAVADIALDVATTLGPGTLSSAALDLSRTCVADALETTEIQHDLAGQAMALLTLVRYNRFQSRTFDRMSLIQHVLTQAVQTGDRELQCQAFTAQGDEFIASKQHDAGLNAYRQAVKVLAPGDGAAMGKWALQRLLDEMSGRATA